MNRSVNAPRHYPKPPSAPPKHEPKPPPGTPKPRVRRLGARRAGHSVVAVITFNGSVDLKYATVWLTRSGLVVAAATEKHVRGRRSAVRLAMRKRARGGRYELTVATKDRHRHVEYEVAKIVLQ